MKAITVQQPWAWAIATGAKTVENRTRPHPWTSTVGQRIAIHAGKGWDNGAIHSDTPLVRLAQLAAAGGDPHKSIPTALLVKYLVPTFHHQGAVMATATLNDVHLDRSANCTCADNAWAERDVWHLVLGDIRPVKPVAARGYQGLWTVPADVLEQLDARR